MRRKNRSWNLVGALALLVLLQLAGPVRAEEDAQSEAAVRAYAREQLVRNATDSVDPGNREAGGLDDLKAFIADKREIFQRLGRAEDLRKADLLLGRTKDEDGLIREAARLYRWIAGLAEEPAGLILVDAAGKEHPLKDDTSESDLISGRLDVDRSWMAEPTKKGGISLLRGRAALLWQSKLEAAQAQSGETGDDLLTSPWLDPLLLALVHADELKTFACHGWVEARKRQVDARVVAFTNDNPPRGLVSEGTVRDKAERAQRLRDTASALAQDRDVLVAALDRMVFAERLLKEESGRLGFLIEEAKREQAQRAEAKAQAAADKAAAEKAAAEKAAAEKAEAEKAAPPKDAPGGDLPPNDMPPKDAPPKDAPPSDAPPNDVAPDDDPEKRQASEKLWELQLHEIIDEQELRLLYIAARRADVLIKNYDAAINQVKEEAQAAAGAHGRYESELVKMRRERQLERLGWEESELKRLRKQAGASAKDGDAASRPLWSAYEEALGSLIALNRLTGEGVALRRALEARVKPDCGPGGADAAAGTDEEGCLPGEAPEFDQPAPATQADLPVAKDELRRYRAPNPGSFDADYVRDASEMLDHPAWDGALAAEHHRAVQDRITALEQALSFVGKAPELNARFDQAARKADEALARVEQLAAGSSQSWRWRRRLGQHRREDLETDRSAFLETMRGIDEEQDEMRSLLGSFRAYRDRLLNLGSRSFQIRVQRTLDPDRLEAAYDDIDATVENTGRWLTLRGDEHAGTFIQRNWVMLLACLGVLVGSVLCVRFGRHGLDRLLRTLASRVPALRSEPVTVRAEEAQAKREKAEQEAAAKAAEEQALRQVSKEEADRQQKMGEGGYGGGADA